MKSTSPILLLALVIWIASTHVEGRVRGIRGAGFCVRRRDGPYAVGCIPQFVTCRSKKSHIMSCRDGQFFDIRTNKCVPKWYASSCHGYGYQRPSHAFIPMFTPTEPLDSSFCSQRQDGDYNIGCVSTYITCVGRHAHAKECPGSLVLDEVSDMCVEKIYVGICGGSPTTTMAVEIPALAAAPVVAPPPAAAPSPVVSSYPALGPHAPAEYPPVVAAAEARDMLPTVKHCQHHVDGFFGLGCSSLYFACINGQPVYKKCPRDFTFHEKKLICVPKCEVRGCECLSTMTPPTTTETPTSEATVVVPTTSAEVLPCTPHKSGLFALGCSPRYLVCVNGLPTYNSCKYGVFDERKKSCLPRHLVKRCLRPAFIGEAY